MSNSVAPHFTETIQEMVDGKHDHNHAEFVKPDILFFIASLSILGLCKWHKAGNDNDFVVSLDYNLII